MQTIPALRWDEKAVQALLDWAMDGEGLTTEEERELNGELEVPVPLAA